MLEVKNLKKSYGSMAAVKNVSFQVGKGESVGVHTHPLGDGRHRRDDLARLGARSGGAADGGVARPHPGLGRTGSFPFPLER